MIEFYTYGAPSCWMVSIMLEECGFEYVCHTVDVTKSEHTTAVFERISPNHTVPAILDRDGPESRPIRIFEAAAILIYLAEKAGRLRGNSKTTELEAFQWMMVVMTGLAPIYNLNLPLKIDKSKSNENNILPDVKNLQIKKILKRYVSALDFRLREYQYLAKVYTIADVAAYPWIYNLEKDFEISLSEFVGVNNWYARLERRKAIRSGMAVP